MEVGVAQSGRPPNELEAVSVQRVLVHFACDVFDDGGLGDCRPLVLDRLAFRRSLSLDRHEALAGK